MEKELVYTDLRKENERSDQEVIAEEDTEGQAEHLNAVLRTFRSINRLIINEADLHTLLEGACNSLVNILAYQNPWIALLDRNGGLDTVITAGNDSEFDSKIQNIKMGDQPECIRKTFGKQGVMIMARSQECELCPISDNFDEQVELAARLEYEGKVYGLISTIAPSGKISSAEEFNFFEEVAGHIAFGLHNIGLKEDRNRNQKALQESEKRYRDLYENAPAAYISTNPATGKIIECNMSAVLIYGYDKDELLNMNVMDLFADTADGKSKAREVFKRFRSGEYIHDVEVQGKNKDESLTWISLSIDSVKNSSGAIVKSLSTAIDITKRKIVEDALRESEEKHRTFMESISDLLHILDKNGNLTYVNESMCTTLGYSKAEMMGMNINDILHKKEIDVYSLKNDVLVRNGKMSGDFNWVAKTGEKIFGTAEVVAIYDKNGKFSGSKTIFHNLTSQKKIENEKKILEDRLRQSQKMEAIGTLAGGIAHDFNNILSAIIGYSELALSEAGIGSQVYSNVKEAFKAGHRARELVRHILTFSRQSDQELKPMRMSPIIKEVMKFLRSSLPATIEIRCSVDIPDEQDTVFANPTEIHQVLMNLCTNASHAMGEKGGLLEVFLKRVDLDLHFKVHYPDIEPGPYLMLTVQDTGSGMTPDVIKRIFEPYFTTKEADKGTGLGLAVVHGIVKSYGGVITVNSEPGQGTAFHVHLPLIIKETSKKETDETTPIPRGSEKVLFVDDEQVLVDMGKQMLEYLGYEVEVRISSIDALELFRNSPERFDLVITDMTMPNMTGDVLSQKLMELRDDIPVVLCTGYSESISEDKARSLGIKAFTMKPLMIRDLAETVRKVLDDAKEL